MQICEQLISLIKKYLKFLLDNHRDNTEFFLEN